MIAAAEELHLHDSTDGPLTRSLHASGLDIPTAMLCSLHALNCHNMSKVSSDTGVLTCLHK